MKQKHLYRKLSYAVIIAFVFAFVPSAAEAAVVAAHLTEGAGAHDKASLMTASITPGANQLILAWIVNSDNNSLDTPTLSGNGLTWVQVNTVTWKTVANPKYRITLFRAMGSSPATGSVTINFATKQQSVAWTIEEFSGVDTSGTNGSGAVVQSAVGSNDTAGPSGLTITLPSAIGSGNATAGGFGNDHDKNSIFPGAGYAAFPEANTGGPKIDLRAEWRADGNTTVNVTQTGSHAIAGIVVEIGMGSPTTTTTTTTSTTTTTTTSTTTTTTTTTVTSTTTTTTTSTTATTATTTTSTTTTTTTTTTTSTTTTTTTSTTTTTIPTAGLVLGLRKSVNKTQAVIGDILTYTVSITNTVARDVTSVKVIDQIPPDFKYLSGSTVLKVLNGSKVADPQGHQPLTFDAGVSGGFTVPASSTVTLMYQLIVGSGATQGVYENRAYAFDSAQISNEDKAEVTITLDPIFDLGTIIGKVFHDRNGNGVQDPGEEGVLNAMIALDDGSYVLTDQDGKYHFPAVQPGERLLKINKKTLPLGASISTEESRIIQITPGLLAKVNFGVDYRLDEERIGAPAEEGLLLNPTDQKGPTKIVGSIVNMEALINGTVISLPLSDVKLEVQELDDVLKLKGDQLKTPAVFKPSLTRANEVDDWSLAVTDSQERLVKLLKGKGAPPEKIQWNGVDELGGVVKGGEVYQYVMTLKYRDGSRAMSSRRLFGVNKESIVSLSLQGSAFESGKAVLNPKTKGVLTKVAEILRQYPKEKILIEGHTDSIGNDEYNTKLSLDRANSAKEYLVNEEGIASERLIVKGYGKSRPVASNLLEEGRELNRRVEIKGEVKEVQAGKILDQFRTEPNVLINQETVPVDEEGRFETQLAPEANQVQISMLNQQGRFLETTVPLPTVTILGPQTGQFLGYGDRNEKYQVADKSAIKPTEPVIRYLLEGKTEPKNSITIDGKVVPVSREGLFNIQVPLYLGKNIFGIVAVNPLSATRIVNEMIELSDTQEGKLIIAVRPIPQLMVQLPPKGIVIPSKQIVVQGKTLPENRVQVNGAEVKLNEEGNFAQAVELPTGKSVLSIVVTDPEGNQGRISREVVVDTNQVFFMALADTEMGLLNAKGNLENANAEKGLYSDGRLAYYLKGTVLGKYLITSAMDTGKQKFGRIFKDLDKADNDRLLTNLDPDKFYPVYGDDSQVVYDAQSRGRFFLAIDSDEFHAIFGDYQTGLDDTELAAYNRTLYGARASYQSVSKTQYGTPDTRVVLFGAQVKQAHAHDELRGTGGSLYYLRQGGIIEGSEQVRIEVRDKDTSRVLLTLPQRQNGDYTIKYDEARIIFKQPVHSVVESGSIVDIAPLSGHSVYILVDYEYQVSSLDKTAYGGHVRQQVGDHLAVGGTYIKDEQSGGSYVLKGMDAETRLGKGTRILTEYAESSGVDSNSNVSYDGGLTYTATTAVSASEPSGKAYKIEVESDIGEWFDKKDWLKVGAYYKKLEAGFTSNGTVLEQGTEKYGLEARFTATPSDHLTARYDVQELLAGGNAASTAQTGGSRVTIGTLQEIHRQGNWTITGEYQHRSTEQIGQQTTMEDTFAARASLKIDEKWAASLEQQAAMQGSGITQTSVGLDYKLDKSFTTQLRGIVGSQGTGALLAAVAQLDDKSHLYMKQGVMVKEGVGATDQTVVGGEEQVTKATRTYGEYRRGNGVEGAEEAAVLGVANQWRFLSRWRFTLDYERGWLAQVITRTTRDVLSFGVGYIDPEFIKALSRFEIRREKAEATTMQYLFTNHLELKLNRDFTLLGKFNWSETRNQATDAIEAALTEASVGLAYRPVAHDRFNLLARATMIRDQRPISLTNNLPESTQKDIFSAEGAYDITSRFQLVEKIALKIMEETVPGLPTADSQTGLWINRLNYHVTRKWDVGLEYRILKQFQAHDQQQGFLIEVDREILDHLRIGAGINLTNFTDSEYSNNNYSTQRFFIRVQGKY